MKATVFHFCLAGLPVLVSQAGPVLSQECGYDEVMTQPDGCLACLNLGEADRVAWSGQCISNRIDGEGVLEWYDGDELIWMLSTSPYQSVRGGSLFFDYGLRGAYTIEYIRDNELTLAGCDVEIEQSRLTNRTTFNIPIIRVEFAENFPIHVDEARIQVMRQVEDQVRLDCSAGLSSAGISMDVADVATKLLAQRNGSDREPFCSMQTRISDISDCFSNPNPWALEFGQDLFNISSNAQMNARLAEEERQRQAEESERAAFQSEINNLRARIDIDWEQSLNLLQEDDSLPLPNLADFIRQDPANFIGMMAVGRPIWFVSETIGMQNGTVIATMVQSPTPIYAELELMVRSRQAGWDGWLADLNRTTQSESYRISCLVDPADSEAFGVGLSITVAATLVDLQGQNMNLRCIPISHLAQTLSTAEREAFRIVVQSCWAVDPGSEAGQVAVTVRINLDRDGHVGDDITLVSATEGSDEAVRDASAAARRAILRCQGEGYLLPPEKYDQWQTIELTLDPRIVAQQ